MGLGFARGLVRAAVPAVTGVMQGKIAGQDRARQMEMDALQRMLLQERINEIPVARKERAEAGARQSMLDAEASNDRMFNQKRMLRQDKVPGPESLIEGLGPDGRPDTFAVPRGAAPRPLGVAPIPKPPTGGGAGGARTIGQLRREFNGFVKPYEGLAQAFRKIRGAAQDPSAAGDLSVVFGYMKLLDPASVVRESEQATATNAAGVPDRVRAAYNRLLSGERLAPAQRDDFVRQAGNLIRSQQSALTSQINRYRGIAESNDIDPEQVVYDPFEGVSGEEEPVSADDTGGESDGLTPAERAFEAFKRRQR